MRRLLLFFFSAVNAASALTLHVSPEGNDASPGRADAPLRTLQGARDAVRKITKRGETIHVQFADGEYAIGEAVVFEPQDGGTPEHPVIYEAEPGAHPFFTGGATVTGFTKKCDGLWECRVPESWPRFEQLWVNGVRGIRARTPNHEWFQAASAATEPVPGVKLAAPLDRTALNLRPADIPSLQGLTPEELHEVNAVVYHSWNVSRHRLAGVSFEGGTLQFTGPARWAFFQMEPYHRVHLENYRAALDAPGEWFLDRDRTLFYMPRVGESIETTKVVAPLTAKWLELRGDRAAGHPLASLHFKDLRFAHSLYTLPNEGWTDAQADAGLGAAIEAADAENVRFENCEITHAGAYAIWFRRGCRDSAIVHSHLHELGAGGVKIGESTMPKAGEETGGIRVENCIIQEGGRYFTGAVGVWIGHSGDNSIVHNDIGDFFYSAISAGWVWGFKPSPANHNHIDFNHLHHLGWGVLSDLGAIYTLGPAPGTTIRGNRIHDIACYSYGGWGIYPDEGTSEALIENNLVYRTESGGFHQHYGEKNLVRNNIFADAREMQLRHSRSEDHLAFTFTGNIVLWKEGKLLGHLDRGWLGSQVALSKNLYWRADGQPFDFAGKTFAEWQAAGQDTGSLIADPLFIDPEHGDFHFKPGSPYAKIGFRPFDYSLAGVTGDPEWRALAAARRYPEMDFSELKLEPTPLTFHEGFEQAKMAERMGIFRVQNGGDPKAALIVPESPSEGKLCLKLTDGPEIKPQYNPHFYCSPHHRRGTTRFAFDVRVEPAMDLVHEWRDSATPYHTGPALRIRNGGLEVAGKKLLEIPAAGEWLHVEIACSLGESASGGWTLTASRQGQPAQHFEKLPFAHAAFRTLEWLGFTCAGTAKASVWFDDLRLTPEL